MSKWTEPFGFTKERATVKPEGNLELLVLLTVLVLDILTLPLAVFRGADPGDERG